MLVRIPTDDRADVFFGQAVEALASGVGHLAGERPTRKRRTGQPVGLEPSRVGFKDGLLRQWVVARRGHASIHWKPPPILHPNRTRGNQDASCNRLHDAISPNRMKKAPQLRGLGLYRSTESEKAPVLLLSTAFLISAEPIAVACGADGSDDIAVCAGAPDAATTKMMLSHSNCISAPALMLGESRLTKPGREFCAY